MKSLGSNPRVRRAATLAVGLGVIGSVAFAGPGMADVPLAGVNCKAGTPTLDGGGQPIPGTGPLAADNGKIAGHGSTFARQLHIIALIPGYTNHVCGPVPDEHHARDMILYDAHQVGPPAQWGGLPTWPLVSTNVPGPVGTIGLFPDGLAPPTARVGSGAGIRGNKCRTAAFHMSDTPHTVAEQQTTRGDPDTYGWPDADCIAIRNDVNFNPPYAPATPTVFPDPADTVATSTQPGTSGGTMVFPLGGGAVAVGVNLGPAQCNGITPAKLNLTGDMASALFGGTIELWTELAVPDNPDLANCVGVPVTRVVRQDVSGTTTQFKNYLVGADGLGAPNPRICDATTSWPILNASSAVNTTWPDDPPSAACPDAGQPGDLIRPVGAGGNQVVAEVNARPGAVGYADLANWTEAPSATVRLANLEPDESAGLPFVPPDAASASNCNLQADVVTPGVGPNGAVGLSPTNQNWATNANPPRSNLTHMKSYPACALTWAMVYTGLNGNNPAVNSIARLTANQRRTLFSYMIYALSPLGQMQLVNNGYAGHGIVVLSRIRDGFIANY